MRPAGIIDTVNNILPQSYTLLSEVTWSTGFTIPIPYVIHYLTGKPVGETVLYFGCRNKDKDYLYEEELTEYSNSGLIKVSESYSCFYICLWNWLYRNVQTNKWTPWERTFIYTVPTAFQATFIVLTKIVTCIVVRKDVMVGNLVNVQIDIRSMVCECSDIIYFFQGGGFSIGLCHSLLECYHEWTTTNNCWLGCCSCM